MKNKYKIIFTVLGMAILLFFLSEGSTAQSAAHNRTFAFSQRDKKDVSQNSNPDITLNLRNVSLEKALKIIAKQAEAGLYYKSSLLPDKKINLNVKAVPLSKVLHEVLNGTSLKVTTSGRNIMLHKKKAPLQKVTQPEEVITGTVTNAESGNFLPGGNILVKGTSAGATTDSLGHYSVNVSSLQDTLVFSYIGFVRQVVPINGRTTINVQLEPTTISGNQLVVVGYGTQQESDLTGAISTVSSEEIEGVPVSNVMQALQGKVAGAQIINSSGAPNSSPSVVIRGLSSLHQPNPLYIVDGVRVSPDNINNINPQDIASVSVLKDASAAAIYGAGAAGGVILIQTKKGTTGKPSIAFSARYGVTHPKLIHLTDKQNYIKLQNIINPQYFANATQTDTLANTDWTDELYNTGANQKYNLAISGGNDEINYRFSGFYDGQDGVYIENYSNHYGVRINSDYHLFDFLEIGEHLDLSQRQTKPTVPGRFDLSYHNAPFRSLPIIPVRNEEGGWGTVPNGYGGLPFSGVNPVGGVETAHPDYLSNNVRGTVHATLNLPLNFTFKTHLSYAYYQDRHDYFQEAYDFGNTQQGDNSLTKASIENSQLLSNFVLSYDNDFLGLHHLNALAGFEEINSKYNNINARETSIGLAGRSFVQTSNSDIYASGKYDPNSLIKSEFGRINYNYNEKYFLSASLRQDANFTVFGPNNKRGTFGSVSAGWSISNESFFEPLLPVINRLKLRGSYGSIGNSNIGSYNYLSTYSQFAGNGGTAIGAQNFAPGAPLIISNTISAVPNPNLHWERDYETNVGVDGELFAGRLAFSVDWYKRTTKGMLYALPLPLSSGYTLSYLTNIGKVTSKGTDISVGYKDHRHALNYNIKITGGFNRNEVNDLGGASNSAVYDGENYYNLANSDYGIMPNENLTITKAGLPFGSFYGYKALGLFESDEAAANSAQPDARAGDIRFEDVSGDGQITADDRQVIGNPNPKFVYGINIGLNYKHFDLSMNWNGVAGVDLFNGVKAYEMYPFSDGNTTTKVFEDSYLGDNDLTPQPRLGVKNDDGSFTLDPNGNYTTVNSYFVENGSYLKLKNIQLGYNFSSTFLNNLGIGSARLYLVAHNLLTITSYSGLDPELSSSYSAAAQGGAVSNNALTVTTRGIDIPPMYPHIRTYSVGFNINF